jgi:hypothetical protein
VNDTSFSIKQVGGFLLFLYLPKIITPLYSHERLSRPCVVDILLTVIILFLISSVYSINCACMHACLHSICAVISMPFFDNVEKLFNLWSHHSALFTSSCNCRVLKYQACCQLLICFTISLSCILFQVALHIRFSLCGQRNVTGNNMR